MQKKFKATPAQSVIIAAQTPAKSSPESCFPHLAQVCTVPIKQPGRIRAGPVLDRTFRKKRTEPYGRLS
ncbi:hypothetical protein [Leisingera sp. M658]|uniref:hypothetical protein n=1 Tax=Leisingera sp. M658 TaxID=2867015 RepID=UPI0021A85149|nr:hypothetical protein [Leisingera sp. M658]UWQ73084.1 hypothetical protein K3724_10825 [Leisingera sp. M658]